MSQRDARREPRIQINLPVVVKLPHGEHIYETKDASYRGVFVTCPAPLPLRKLIRLQAVLDDDEPALEMLGLVAHTVNQIDAQESGRSPGMGIQLFAVGELARGRWRDFIRAEYERRPEIRDLARRLDLPRLSVPMRSREQLEHFIDHDLAGSQIFIRTSDLHPVDTALVCDLLHPDRRASFSLDATVVEVTETPRRARGMRVDFGQVSEDTLSALKRFATSNS